MLFVSVVDERGKVVGYAFAAAYSDRPWYRGIGAFSVYVLRSHRGRGVGQAAMSALIEASRAGGLWKLYSRVFPDNRASLALMARMGFKEIGVHEKHGKLRRRLEGDCINVELLIPENMGLSRSPDPIFRICGAGRTEPRGRVADDQEGRSGRFQAPPIAPRPLDLQFGPTPSPPGSRLKKAGK